MKCCKFVLTLQVISDLNPSGMPLHFTVLFPHGDRGWDEAMKHVDSGKRLTAREFDLPHGCKG